MINDDTHIINEWIIHHIININIDHIYIYDDRSKISINKTISILPEDIRKKVTVIRIEDDINFYNHDDFKNSIYYDMELYIKSENVKQIYFHNHFLKNYKNVSKWCYLCDVDEFIYLNDNINLDNILNEYDNFNIIFIPWLIYGSSFNIEQPDGLVINNFKYHSNKYHKIGKSFYKMNNINYISNPHIINNNHTCFQFSYTEKLFDLPIHINHYQINSVKTYISRKLKLEIGYVGGKIRDPNDIFLFMLSNNDMYSDIMNKFSENINIILKKDASNNVEDNLNIIYCINCLYVNDTLIYNISSYNELLKILNSNTIKYAKFKDLLPNDFDVDNYRLLNKDLNNLTESELLNHYTLFGSNENRKYKNNEKKSELKIKMNNSCDNLKIESNNSELENVKKNNNSNSSNRSNSMKIDEDNSDYDNNSDLENNNLEKNKITKDETSDSDLSDFEKLPLDFDTLPDDFDPEIYKNLHKDLKNMGNIDAINHYINFGKREKRNYKKNNKKSKEFKNNLKYYNEPDSDFDVKIYKELNKDLQYLTDGEAIYHYLTYGINEKRKYIKKDKKKEKDIIIFNGLPTDFDPILYKELNKDLKNLNDEEAIEHYLMHGVNENRCYKKKKSKKKNIILDKKLPNDFNATLYKKLNKDLQHFNDEEAIEHYLIYGINEKRKYLVNNDSDSENSEDSYNNDDSEDFNSNDSSSEDSDSDNSE